MNLSLEQLKAVNSSAPVICMMAGPGSGKTRTLIERTKRLVEDGHIPECMVVITFTNEAARELKSRTDFNFYYCGTLHGYMLRLLQKYGTRIGFSEDTLSVVTEDLRDELLADIQKKMGYKDTKRELQEALDLGPERLKEIKAYCGTLDKAQTTAWAYYQRLIQTSMVDYDSILHFGLMVVKTLDSYDERVLFLFVDEYQDSSEIDAKIYEALPFNNKFYVGDVDQSIYAFRGARVQNMVDLANRDDVEVLLLEDNYRSDQNVTRVAQQLIEQNRDRPKKVTRSISVMRGNVSFHQFEASDEELHSLAKRINALPDSNEVAVLVRSNKLVEYFRDGLRGYGVDIPRERCESMPKDWKLAMLYLSLLCDPENDIIAYRWLCQTKGKDFADNAKLKSFEEYEPLNSLFLNLPYMGNIDPYETLNYLAIESISPESIDRVRLAVNTLDEDESIQQLISILQFDPPKEKTKGVTVSTIHGAKGCEWDHVFLPAFEQGTIPSKSKNASLEEERRLAFVAVTRARHSVSISHARFRPDPWTHRETEMETSQFAWEMGL